MYRWYDYAITGVVLVVSAPVLLMGAAILLVGSLFVLAYEWIWGE